MKRIGFAMVATASLLALSPFWGSAASRTSDLQGSRFVAADLKLPGARDHVRSALEVCTAARKGGRAAAQCAGLIARPCLRLVERSEGQAAADCYRSENAGWVNLLEDYRTRLAKRFETNPSKFLRLRGAEAEWTADWVRRCDKAAGQIGMPSEPAASICEMKESSRRAFYLRLLATEAGVL